MRWILIFCCLFASIPVTSGEDSKTPPGKETPKDNTTVYVTKSGKKYHAADCKYLSKSKVPILLKDATLNYQPCSVCNPPRP